MEEADLKIYTHRKLVNDSGEAQELKRPGPKYKERKQVYRHDSKLSIYSPQTVQKYHTGQIPTNGRKDKSTLKKQNKLFGKR